MTTTTKVLGEIIQSVGYDGITLEKLTEFCLEAEVAGADPNAMVDFTVGLFYGPGEQSKYRVKRMNVNIPASLDYSPKVPPKDHVYYHPWPVFLIMMCCAIVGFVASLIF